MIGSERLHTVGNGDWPDVFAKRANRVLSAPVPFLSVLEEDAGFAMSMMDGTSLGDLAGLSLSDAADLPPEIAELLFGAQAS
jgi:hypothetical protein